MSQNLADIHTDRRAELMDAAWSALRQLDDDARRAVLKSLGTGKDDHIRKDVASYRERIERVVGA